MEYRSKEYVNHFLSMQGSAPFGVIFHTNNGEQRLYIGSIDPRGTRSDSVAIMTDQGWKRFNVNKVLAIGQADEFKAIADAVNGN